MVFVVFRLVSDAEDRLFKNNILEPQISRVDLFNRIEHVTKIPIEYQEIKYRGDELPDSLHPLESINEFEELTVRHSQLSTWAALLDREAAFSQSHEQELKKSIHLDAKTLIENLVQSHQRCCRAFFSKVYGEKSKVTFDSREDGSRAGCICIVDDGSTICRFFIKTHHGAGDKSSHSQYDIDIKELFVYTFLEALKMGAEIQFISNELFSRWIIFLASREVPNFSTLEVLELTEPESVQRYSKSVVEMLCAYSILMLADHHTANMGFDSELNPYILDFFITGRRLTAVRDIHDGVRMSKIIK
ncbi:unnamed protein product [Caenorhabditis auriculariae]|uniref:Ubiquitin-like domain-containing protein n=1 Tax=Caenorhabditis auriculariae TaxID=2777116 RepID=A0A8S1H7P8_9PELO|nr:unnamed protein product [Caenorhabditis auriculariae]